MSIQVNKGGTWQEVSKAEFLELVQNRTIKPDTKIIFNGQEVPASRIRGLTFPAESGVTPPAPPTTIATPKTVPVPPSSVRIVRRLSTSTPPKSVSSNNKPSRKHFIFAGIFVSFLFLLLLVWWTHGTASAGKEVNEFFAKHGSDIHGRSSDGTTLLQKAAKEGKTQVVKHLIKKGIDPNIKDSKGQSLLHFAACGENIECVRMLLEMGMDVNIQDSIGSTPLHKSSLSENEKIAELLIEKGATINAKDEDGKTPLFWAVWNERPELINLLIRKGANVNERANDGQTPIFEIYGNEDRFDETLDSLIKNGGNINIQDKKGKTPLHHAISQFDLISVRAFVERGANLFVKNNDGRVPASFAIITAYTLEESNGKAADLTLALAIRDYLIEVHRKRGDLPKKSGEPVAETQKEIKDFCDTFGTDIKSKDEDGNTLLHKAAINQSVRVIEYLVQKGANINAKNNIQWTPLHCAVAWNKNTDVLQYLVSKGADPLSVSSTGLTPLQGAKQSKNHEVAKILESKIEKDIFYAAENGNLETIKTLISRGVNINIRTTGEHTLLHRVTNHCCDLGVVKYLLANGVDVNAKTTGNWTALHFAAGKNADVRPSGPAVVHLLIVSGAHIDIKNNANQTPLHLAAERNNLRSVVTLVSAGANVNAKDRNGKTPLELAKGKGHSDIVAYLVDLK